MREEKRRVDDDMYQIRKEFDDEKVKSTNLQQQNERLRSLVENLDSTKEELLKRLQSSSHTSQSSEQDKALLLSDIATYKRDLLTKDAMIADLRKSIEVLDASVDEL